MPLELGGAPKSELNLWPEPQYGTETAANKDTVENKLKKAVCAGRSSSPTPRTPSSTTGPPPSPTSVSADAPPVATRQNNHAGPDPSADRAGLCPPTRRGKGVDRMWSVRSVD